MSETISPSVQCIRLLQSATSGLDGTWSTAQDASLQWWSGGWGEESPGQGLSNWRTTKQFRFGGLWSDTWNRRPAYTNQLWRLRSTSGTTNSPAQPWLVADIFFFNDSSCNATGAIRGEEIT